MARAEAWVKEHSKSMETPATQKERQDWLVTKYGAVLNTKNVSTLKEAQRLIQEVLDSAEKGNEPEPPEGAGLTNIELGKAIAETVLKVLNEGDKTNG